MKNNYRKILLILVFISPEILYAQPFESYIDRQDQFHLSTPYEKIYLHTDKSSYFIGDTLWLKGYILSSVNKVALDSSKLAYIEVINADGEVMKRLMSSCNLGLLSGHIALSKKFPQGKYILRAYTRRLEGFGDSLFFKKSISIIDPVSEFWQTQVQQLQAVNNRLQLSAFLLNPNGTPRVRQPLTVTLKNGSKQVLQARLYTNDSGLLHLDTLMGTALGTSVTVEISSGKNRSVTLPVHNPAAIADLQFLPEGGRFVQGKKQRLGFKAVNSLGKGIDVSGVIKNSKGENVANFTSIHKGMGFVTFTPVAGETYTALLKDGTSHQLPVCSSSGTILSLDNTNPDSIKIHIDATPDQYQQPFHFAITEHGISIASGSIRFSGKPFELSVSKSQFVSGVVVATLYDKNIQPVNERAAFIWLNDGLNISVKANKTSFTARDSVNLQVNVKNFQQQNISGSFSIAVIDTSQVKINPDSENILSRINLSSDVRGWIEDPAYYFKHPNNNATEALMLTQGWVSYRKFPPIKLPPYEKEFSITGSVVNGVGKPLKNTRVNLYGKNGMYDIFFADTTTNDEGIFTFHRFPVYTSDSADIMLRALNKNDKPFSVGIQMLNEPQFPAPHVDAAGGSEHAPFILDLNAQETYLQRRHLNSRFRNDGSFMEEVVVTAKSKIPGSYNLNKDGGSDQTIYKEALDKTPKVSLVDFMLTNVKGFSIGPMKDVKRVSSNAINSNLPKTEWEQQMNKFNDESGKYDHYFKLNANLLRFIIDGVSIDMFYTLGSETNDYLEFQKRILNSFNAEDIKGIEVMDHVKYVSSYMNKFMKMLPPGYIPSAPNYLISYIEITTRGGAGPVMQSTPGTHRLKPLYPTVSKDFYSPKYNNKDNILTDIRSTIYWNSNVVTDKNGNATLSFYTSDNPNKYLIILEGTDLRGNIGYYNSNLY